MGDFLTEHKISTDILLGAFTVLEGVHSYSAFLPSLFTIRHFSSASADDLKSFRDGELYASIFTLALGGTISLILRSYYPLLASFGVIGVMVYIYETQGINYIR